jgi:hypothetical protein
MMKNHHQTQYNHISPLHQLDARAQEHPRRHLETFDGFDAIVGTSLHFKILQPYSVGVATTGSFKIALLNIIN